VFATNDNALAAEATRALDEPTGRNVVDLAVTGALGEPLAVAARCGAWSARAVGSTALAPARGGGLDEALLRDKLGAFGGTPFRVGAIDCGALAAGLHVPASELKDLRRQLVEALLPQLERGPVRTIDPSPALPRVRAAQGAA